MKYIRTTFLSSLCIVSIAQATMTLTDYGVATPLWIYAPEEQRSGSNRIVGFNGDYSAGQRLNLSATGDAGKPLWDIDAIFVKTSDVRAANALDAGTTFSIWDLGENNTLERGSDVALFSEATTSIFSTQYLGAWIEFDLGTTLTLNPADNLAFTIDIKQVEGNTFAAFFAIRLNVPDSAGDHMYNDVVDTSRDMLFVISGTPAAVPEPATAMMLFFGGGVGLVVHRLRRWANR